MTAHPFGAELDSIAPREREAEADDGRSLPNRRSLVLAGVAIYCLLCWLVLFRLGSAAVDFVQRSDTAMAGEDGEGAGADLP